MKEFQEKYKIGLALSGGGIKGLCHAGALKALEEAGIKPDIIAGTSAGAIVGALYGDGYNPDEICEFFRKISFREMTKIRIDEGGLFRIDEFEKFLKNKLRSENLEDLKIPLKIVASDLDNGKSAVFQSGNLLEKIIASSSVPVLFPPKKIDGIHYVDGGVFKNLPASFIRDECKILIGINASPMMTNEYKLGLKNVAIRSYRFMLKSNMFYDKELCDIMIEPTDMSNYNTFNTDKAPEIFEIGYISTKKILSEKYQLGN